MKNNSLHILIVEDEISFAATTKMYLEERGHQVTEICVSFEEAVAAYQNYQPDLVLLDIQLFGEKSGIDFADYLQNQVSPPPHVYLTSQFDQQIYERAIATTPSGYLIKPIHKESLWTTVETAFMLQQQKAKSHSNTLTLHDGSKKYRLKEQEIICIKSDHVYANVFLLNGRNIFARLTLQQFLQKVQSTFLFQCHRSYIVNLQHITTWEINRLTLSNGEIVPVSRSRRPILMQRL